MIKKRYRHQIDQDKEEILTIGEVQVVRRFGHTKGSNHLGSLDLEKVWTQKRGLNQRDSNQQRDPKRPKPKGRSGHKEDLI